MILHSVKRRSAAFSITELLASFVVLTALFAIHWAARSNSKGEVSVLVCVRNLRLLSQAAAANAVDTGKMVHYEDWPHLWMRDLTPYGVEESDRLCSATPKRRGDQISPSASASGSIDRSWLVSGGTNNYQGAYGLNGYCYFDAPFTDQSLNFRSEADVRFPARTPIYSDSVWVDAWPKGSDLPARNLKTGDDFMESGLSRIAIPRHAARPIPNLTDFDPKSRLPGAVNIGFVDTHVELVRLENLWRLEWHRNWHVPQRRPGL